VTEVDVSRRRFLSGALGVLAAAGIFGGVVSFLGYFAYKAGLGMTAQPEATAVVSEVVPATLAATAVSSDLPRVPVEINFPFRHLSDEGYIAHVHNTSDKMVRLVFNMESVSAPGCRTEALDIPAGGTIELGWERGWKLGSGDRVTVTSDGYQGMTWTVPGSLVSR
jgi:hypothetical protein